MKYIWFLVIVGLGIVLISRLLGSDAGLRRAALLSNLRRHGARIHQTAGILAIIVLTLLAVRLILMALRLW